LGVSKDELRLLATLRNGAAYDYINGLLLRTFMNRLEKEIEEQAIKEQKKKEELREFLTLLSQFNDRMFIEATKMVWERWYPSKFDNYLLSDSESEETMGVERDALISEFIHRVIEQYFVLVMAETETIKAIKAVVKEVSKEWGDENDQ